MNKHEARRMLRLATYLERLRDGKTDLDPVRFNLIAWAESWEDIQRKNYATRGRPKCGTVACAVGHIPYALPRSGFWLDKENQYNPNYQVFQGWSAVTEFFGISSHEASSLFSATSYDDPTDSTPVIAAMREFVARKGY